MLEQVIAAKALIPRRLTFNVLGVRVDGVQIPDVVAQMDHWISEQKKGRFIAVTGMHGVMEAQRDPALKNILNAADLVVSDGMPLVWLGRWRGIAMRRRVYGPELMEAFCRETGPRYRHFLYGGAPGVPELLAQVLQQRFETHIVGTFSPPFGSLTAEKAEEIRALIRAAAPDVLWVGLSTPKQERFMFEVREKLEVPVMLGVGAAFDFHTGRVKQAPSWMQEHGLEWFFRLYQEPRRLWRRYLLLGPRFVWNVAIELMGWKKF